MPYTLIVFANPSEGMEAEFNRWYDEVHVPEMCEVPGIVSGRRFKLPKPLDGRNYAVIFEIEADDPQAVLAEAGRRMSSGEMQMSAAMNRESLNPCLLQAL